MTYRRAVLAMLLLAVGAGGLVARPMNAGPIVHTQMLDRSPMGVAVDTRTGRAFITTSDANNNGSVSVLDTHTGALINTIPLGPGLLPLSVSVDERARRAYVINQNTNTLSILDARSGALLRAVAMGQSPALLLVDERSRRVLVVNQSSNTVTVLDAQKGAVLRTVAVGEYPDSAALDARRGRAFVGAFDGTVSVIDTRSGKLLRTTMVGGGVNALAVDQQAGHVIVTSYRESNGNVSVLGAATGALLRTVRVRHTPGAVAVDARTGRAFVTSPTDATLTVLDARSGVQRGTITLDHHTPGATPWVSDALAVDERAGRVFVAEDNGSAAHVSVLDACGRLVRHAGPVGVFPMALAVDARAGHVIIVGGPLLQQRNAFDAMTASLADFLSKHLKQMLTWFRGNASGGASTGGERGSINV